MRTLTLLQPFYSYAPSAPCPYCFYCKTKLCLRVSSWQGIHAFVQESFYLQGTLSDINERDTLSLDYKYKHMLNNGAPPDKFRVRVVSYIENSMI